MILLDGLEDLATRYDGFVLDLWGVIHDGVQPYPGAVGCLEQLRLAGKHCVLLSNAPRRAAAAEAMLRGMGIGASLYTAIMTSGEAVHLALRDRSDPWFAALGERVFHIGPERDRNVMDGLGLVQVAQPDKATFILNTGPDDHAGPTAVREFEDLLQDCARHSLPMICANPDLEVIRGGMRVICAGALAARYQEMGGAVRSVGKPDPAIYRPVLDILGTSASATLAVGDSLRTDIAGATSAGIESCWVLGGIHGETLGSDPRAAVIEAKLSGLAPVAMLRAFTW